MIISVYVYYLSTKKEKKKKNTWVFCAKERWSVAKYYTPQEKKGEEIPYRVRYFPYSIMNNKDFKRVFTEGKRMRSGPFLLTVMRNNLLINRFGFVVSLRVSKKATARNTLRRRMRHAARDLDGNLRKGFDYVLHASPAALSLRFQEIKDIFQNLFTNSNLYGKR